MSRTFSNPFIHPATRKLRALISLSTAVLFPSVETHVASFYSFIAPLPSLHDIRFSFRRSWVSLVYNIAGFLTFQELSLWEEFILPLQSTY